MVLFIHLLFGAVLGSIIKNLPLAVFFSFLGHYFLDLFPHIEYPIENIKNNRWGQSFFEILAVVVDFLLGIFLIWLLSENSFKIYASAFFAALPDGLTILSKFSSNKLLKKHDHFHHNMVHILKNKKIPKIWRFSTQVAWVVILIFLLKS
jgi:hypothetical protein